jgi:hypothetical protein
MSLFFVNVAANELTFCTDGCSLKTMLLTLEGVSSNQHKSTLFEEAIFAKLWAAMLHARGTAWKDA